MSARNIKINVDSESHGAANKEDYLEEVIDNFTISNIEFTLGQATFILLFIFRALYLVQTNGVKSPRASLPLSLFAATAGTAVAVLARVTLFGIPENDTAVKIKKQNQYSYPVKSDMQALYYLEIETNEDGSTKYYEDEACTIDFKAGDKIIDDSNPIYNMITGDIDGKDVGNSIKIRNLESGKNVLDVELEAPLKDDASPVGTPIDTPRKVAVAINNYLAISNIASVNEIIMEEMVETEIYEILSGETVVGLAKQKLKRYIKLKKNNIIDNIYLVVTGNNLLNKSNNLSTLQSEDSTNEFLDIADEVPEIEKYSQTLFLSEDLYNKSLEDKLLLKVNDENENTLNPLNIALDYGNPPRNIQFTFLSVLIPFIFLNVNLRRTVFQMKYFKNNNNKLNYNLFEEWFISSLLVGNIGFVIKRTCDIIAGLVKTSRTRTVIDELSKPDFYILGGPNESDMANSEIIEGTELEDLEFASQEYPALSYSNGRNNFNNNLDNNLLATKKKSPLLSNNITKFVGKIKNKMKGVLSKQVRKMLI